MAFHVYPSPIWTKESQLSLSGPCTKALRAAQQGADPAELALGVETAIGQGLACWLLVREAQRKSKVLVCKLRQWGTKGQVGAV